MGTMSPISPSRADYRFLQKLMESSFEGAEQIPAEFDLVLRVFKKTGGSWERIFKGSDQDITLLKRIIKVALKQKKITKKYEWK